MKIDEIVKNHTKVLDFVLKNEHIKNPQKIQMYYILLDSLISQKIHDVLIERIKELPKEDSYQELLSEIGDKLSRETVDAFAQAAHALNKIEEELNRKRNMNRVR